MKRLLIIAGVALMLTMTMATTAMGAIHLSGVIGSGGVAGDIADRLTSSVGAPEKSARSMISRPIRILLCFPWRPLSVTVPGMNALTFCGRCPDLIVIRVIGVVRLPLDILELQCLATLCDGLGQVVGVCAGQIGIAAGGRDRLGGASITGRLGFDAPITEGGQTLKLQDVQWQTDNTYNADDYEIGDRFTAICTYGGSKSDGNRSSITRLRLCLRKQHSPAPGLIGLRTAEGLYAIPSSIPAPLSPLLPRNL